MDVSTGVYWGPHTYDPSCLGWVFGDPGGCWEVARGSRAEKVVERTPEFEDAFEAAMLYLESGEDYRHNLALMTDAGMAAEYRRSLENSARDYALRTCINDHWHIGDNVGSPAYDCDDPQPPGYVPMRERVEQAVAAERAAAPAASLEEAAQPADALAGACRGAAETMPASATAAVASQVLTAEPDGIGVGTAYPIAVSGSGVQYVTCDHVPRDASDLTVDGAAGSLALSDPERDVAVIEVPSSWAEPVPLATVDPPEGTGVTMLGWSDGEYAEIPGVVAGYDTHAGIPGSVAPTTPVMLIACAGRGGPGLSGGPVVDAGGQVVGHVLGRGAESEAVYAVPASEIRDAIGATPEPAEEHDAELAAEMAGV
jgi:Trypsin-like peptidase domain